MNYILDVAPVSSFRTVSVDIYHDVIKVIEALKRVFVQYLLIFIKPRMGAESNAT